MKKYPLAKPYITKSEEKEVLQVSQILYPCMQVADIFYLQADFCQLGMDQRKVNVLARELGPKLGFWKPVAIHHHMLLGLGEPSKTENALERALEMKMSKSKPETAIFMTDSAPEVEKKIQKAYCPEGTIEENPLLEYCKYILFEKFPSFPILREEKYGGNITFTSYTQLEKAFASRKVHPSDLKRAVAHHLNLLLSPIQQRLVHNPRAQELYHKIKNFDVTR